MAPVAAPVVDAVSVSQISFSMGPGRRVSWLTRTSVRPTEPAQKVGTKWGRGSGA